MTSITCFLRRTASALLLCALAAAPLRAAPPHWIRVSSTHFSVVTDAGEKKGQATALRLEQMRAVFAELLLKTRLNVPVPIESFALASAQEYAQTAPQQNGAAEPGTFLSGEDRDFILLNLAVDDSWYAVAHDFAAALLNYNYPPTQPWFDEGFAAYFAAIHLDDKQVRIGDPPPSTTDPLSSQSWMPIPELFAVKAGNQQTPQFRAESWLVMHYLLANNKLSETGNYFDLVQNRNTPIAQAIAQAYGMPAAQLDQAIKDYFHALAAPPTPAGNPPGVQTIPTPVSAENFATTTTPVTENEAAALLAEVRLRIPDRRPQAVAELQGMVKAAAAAQVSTDNSIIHRALAWSEMQDKDYSNAMQELSAAMDLDEKDTWVRYYLALMKYRVGETNGGTYPGLANMMQDLRIVLDWYPEFAEAYNMLGMARLQGGGANSAMEAIRAAIQLAPRNQRYLLDLAQAYMAAKKWEAASSLLVRLIGSSDPQVAAAATRNFQDLPYLQKYGIPPQHPEDARPAQASNPLPEPPRGTAQKTAKPAVTPTPSPEDESEGQTDQPPQQPAVDKRPPKFLKGRLIAVNCSQSPVAIITFAAGGKTLHLRTEDYKSLLLIGPDQFSCDWKNLPAEINYKEGGRSDGDIVSLELQK